MVDDKVLLIVGGKSHRILKKSKRQIVIFLRNQKVPLKQSHVLVLGTRNTTVFLFLVFKNFTNHINFISHLRPTLNICRYNFYYKYLGFKDGTTTCQVVIGGYLFAYTVKETNLVRLPRVEVG